MTSQGKIISAAFVAIFVATTTARATDTEIYSNASLAASFDSLLDSARSQGLAGAFAGEADEVSDMLQNPACLAQVRSGQVALQHHNWIGDVMQETVVAGVPLGAGRGLGLLADFVNYGFIEGRDESGDVTRPLGASDLGLGLGYGQNLWGPISAGATFRTLHQTLADRTYDSFAGDLGLLFEARRVYRIGISYSNFGTPMAGYARNGDLLMSMSYLFETRGDATVLLGTGYDYQPQSASRFRLGLEAGFRNAVFLRAGYQFSGDLKDREGVRGPSFGAGFKLVSAQLDYSFTPFSDLGVIQRLGLAYHFANEEAPPPFAPPPLYALNTQAVPAPGQAQAVTESGQALELYFHLPQDSLASARGLAARAKYREAIAAYARLLADQPNNPAAWKELANLYFQVGLKDFGFKCLQAAEKAQAPKAQP